MDYHHHCLLSVKHAIITAMPQSCVPSAGNTVHLCHTALLCTAATDGQLAFWDVTPSLLARSQDTDPAVIGEEPGTLRSEVMKDSKASARKEVVSPGGAKSALLCSVEAHQSGVNDVAIRTTTGAGEYELLVASVGDDSALVITILHVLLDCHGSSSRNYTPPKLSVAEQLHEPGAHHSSITGQ